jgi:hypothetical protein
MYFSAIQSDQLYTWSDEYPPSVSCYVAKAPQYSSASTPSPPSDPPRFSHRALQTMRQAGMQMRRRSGPWPQVLFVGQLSWFAAADGLRAAGVVRANRRVPRQLPSSPRDSGIYLRDQSRTAAQTRGALGVCHAPSEFRHPDADGCPISWHAPGQYAGGLARQRCQRFAHRGGRG